MKKVLFAMVAVVALTISSCCNNKAKETTCDKANTECVAATPCCKAACEVADSCQKACKAACEMADSCQQKCKTACEKACEKAVDCKKECEKACEKACEKK